MKKSKLVQLYKLKSINIENKKQQELRKMYNFYERKLAEEKSRFDSLLRDKIKQGKRLKRAKKGIEYWKNECNLIDIDRKIIQDGINNLHQKNEELKQELKSKYNAYTIIDGEWSVSTDAEESIDDLKAHNKSLLIGLEKTREALYNSKEPEQEVFNDYHLYFRNGDLLAADDNDNTIIVGKKHG